MTLTQSEYDLIRSIVREKAGIALEDGKEYLVENRMTGLIRGSDLDSLEAIVEGLRRGSDQVVDAVVDALTTNETSFFRDLRPFTAMIQGVLPELIERNAHKRSLSIWCGAASSGQEPYTMAMLLRENFPELASWELRFSATDVSDSMLERCREACYSQLEISRGLPAKLLIKYFVQDGNRWSVKPELKSMIQFRKLNLIQDLPHSPRADLVLLRNVLIYFEDDVKKAILENVRLSLDPKGYLLLGTAETVLDTPFRREKIEESYFYRPES